MSHLFEIKDLVEQYIPTFKNFVETGCYLGTGIHNALDSFGIKEENVYSCDVMERHVQECKNKFPKATLIQSNSVSFLKQILPELTGETLYWLDAHYPNLFGYGWDDEIRTPLFEELELIKTLKKDYQNDVIVCDDMRVIRDTDNPTYNPNDYSDADKEYYYVDVSWKKFKKTFEGTHIFMLYEHTQGIGIFVPK